MVKAYPCGRPVDGRPRYGMTPVQAILYRDLVDRFGHAKGLSFQICQRPTALRLGLEAKMHVIRETKALVERGWIEETEPRGYYRLIEPVMRFPKVPTRWEEE